ncbi:MAG: FAD-binding oxidoreductase, partial [Planktomarina sp.]|nr:FAD-binding oxidoreductase [Planktomarina sp.]
MLTVELEADVAIIGAGFTGLSAALHLAKLGKQVVVLEAQTPGWGASGRNGGQVNPGFIKNPNHAISKFGVDIGRRMIALSGNAGKLVFNLIAQHDIQCDARPVGWLRAAHNATALQSLERKARQWQTHGAPMQRLSAVEVAELLGTDAYIGGIMDPRGGNIHPLNFALGLADAAIAVGAKVYGQTKVETVSTDGPLHTITSMHGRVRARKVLVCTNGYTDDLIPGLRQSVVPIRSVQVATAPLSDNLRASILPGLHAPSDTRRLLSYFRTDATGRFIMGARGAYTPDATQARFAQVRAITVELFPQLADVKWQYEWGGYIAATADHYPHLHDMGNGIAAGLGYNGRGVAMAISMGKVLADWASGMPKGDLGFPVSNLRKILFHRLHR